MNALNFLFSVIMNNKKTNKWNAYIGDKWKQNHKHKF